VRVRHSLLGTILLAACYPQPKPVTAPHPKTVVAAGSPRGGMVASATEKGATDATTPAPAIPSLTQVEVAKRALDVFGDSLAAPPPKSVEAAEPTWDMDVRSYETRDRVAHYVSMFTGRSRERIAERLERGSRYEPMIRAKMKAGGLPEDMYYLALVESGFDPHAYSRAAAVGMWQFMTSTARDMGLRVDRWVDERRDPVRSTEAAVRFIRGLRDQFGSLYLAAAAYNGGPGRVSRGLARYADDLEGTPGDDAFFVLAEKDYLRNETREYVPQLIAAALIAKEPARYGMEIHTLPPLAYDSVRVAGSTPLAAVATAAGVSTRDILELNPQFLRGMTPPGDRFLVRIPDGSAARFDSAFATLGEKALKATTTVETKKGDTAARLANAHGISRAALEDFNPSLRKLKSGRLAPGQRVVIPSVAVAAASLDVPDPAIEKYPHSAAHAKVHTVRRGETLGGIARKYSTTPEHLMRINGMRRAMIFPGQTILLSGPSRKARAEGSRKSASRSSSKARSRSSSSSKSKAGTKKPSASAGKSKKNSGAG
jgi:membrane-bound lytic murein transglycosylase D